MKIREVQVSPLKSALVMPFRIATGEHRSLDNLLLTIILKDGTPGYGEAAIATHITGETLKKTAAHLKAAAAFLRGREIGEAMSLCARARCLFGTNMAAVAALEMALLDALTKTLGIPLWKLWGARPRVFATDITLVVGSLPETLGMARKFYAKGFRAFKIKVGTDMDLDIKRVEAVSRMAGGAKLLLDANGALSAAQALFLLGALKARGVRLALIEQPVAKDDWEGLKRVTTSTNVPVCADESAGSFSDAARIIQEKAAGAINVKLMKTGIIHAVHIAGLARAGGVKLMLGGMMESPLAMTAAAHLACGLGCFDFIDLDTPFFIKEGLKNHPCLDGRGRYDLRGVNAGIGIIP